MQKLHKGRKDHYSHGVSLDVLHVLIVTSRSHFHFDP